MGGAHLMRAGARLFGPSLVGVDDRAVIKTGNSRRAPFDRLRAGREAGVRTSAPSCQAVVYKLQLDPWGRRRENSRYF
jgi:hypothetical protein